MDEEPEAPVECHIPSKRQSRVPTLQVVWSLWWKQGWYCIQHQFFSLFILYYGHLFKLIGKDTLHSFPRLQNAVINYRMPVSVGSGEVLNDTVEGIHSMDGAPVTDVGSGDGSFIQVTEEVSEWWISCAKSVVNLFAHFRLDGDLYWARWRIKRVFTECHGTEERRPRAQEALQGSPRTGGGDAAPHTFPGGCVPGPHLGTHLPPAHLWRHTAFPFGAPSRQIGLIAPVPVHPIVV